MSRKSKKRKLWKKKKRVGETMRYIKMLMKFVRTYSKPVVKLV